MAPEIPGIRAADAMAQEWRELVKLSLSLTDERVDATATTISRAAKIGFESVRRKLNAIRHAATLGYSEAEIIDQGQEQTLSIFQKGRRESTYTDKVWLKFQIPGSQRELVQQEIERIKRVLGLKDSEQVWDFMLAQLINVTDEELKQAAGR